MPIKNYYTVLGVESTATQDEIKLAYRKLVRQFHPDRNYGNPSFEEHFKLIQEAYDALKDPKKRDNYDARLAYDTYTSDPVEYVKFIKEQRNKPRKYKKPNPKKKKIRRKLIFNSGGAAIALIILAVGIFNVVTLKSSRTADVEQQPKALSIGEFTYEDSAPQLADEYYHKAINYFDERNFKLSLIYLQKALDVSPEDPKLYFNRGLIYYLKRKHKQALKDFNRTIKLDPTYENAYWVRAKLKYEMDDNKGAIADFTEAIKLDPYNDSLYFNRGLAYYYVGEYESAIADIDKAIELNPNQPQYYFDRGDAKEMSGDLNGTCSDWKKAKEMGYHSPEYKSKECIMSD